MEERKKMSNLKQQWISVKVPHPFQTLEVEFLIDDSGNVLARLRKSMHGFDPKDHVYRLYAPPVSIDKAADNSVENFYIRDRIYGIWGSDELRRAVENKRFGQGGLKVVTVGTKSRKLLKGIKQVPGPYGGVRYVDITTKKYVKTPR